MSRSNRIATRRATRTASARRTATCYVDGQKLGTVNLLVKILPVSPSPSASP